MIGDGRSSTDRCGRTRCRARARARAVLTALLLALGTAVTVAPPGHAASGGPVASAAAAAAPAGRAAYLAERLRENPVHISDQVPRSAPLSVAAAYEKQARRTGVPTYVMILPPGTTGPDGGEGLLAAVHDRLGRDGLYVLMEATGIGLRTAAYGVDVPAQDAGRATLYELPYDAGPLRTLTHFVDVLRTGGREAARRAEASAEADRDGGEPENSYISETDREDQSVLTGFLLASVPSLILLLTLLRRGDGRRAVPVLYAVPLAGAALLTVAFTAPVVFDQTRSSGDPPPTAQDMSARVDRVTEGLRRQPVYADPESEHGLGAAQRAALSEHIEALGVPVRIAVVPMSGEDESGGDGDLFADSLHRALRKDAVYVVADPGDGISYVANHGARLSDEKLYDSTEKFRYGRTGEDADEATGGYEELDALLDRIEEVPSGPPGRPYLDPSPAEDPVEEESLPPLWTGSVWGGALLGALAALLALGLAAAVLATVRRRRGSGDVKGAGRSSPSGIARKAAAVTAGDGPDAPARPGDTWLRKTARRELGEFNAEFERVSGQSPSGAGSRAWRCLDAATLLLDQEGDGRVDPDADAPTLAAAIVLLRAGRAALTATVRGPGTGRSGTGRTGRTGGTGAAERLCSLNPMHGPAAGRAQVKREGMDKARSQHVCVRCRRALASPAGDRAAPDTRLLCLRTGPDGAFVPYDRLPGPLGTAEPGGISTDHLVDDVLEHLGVH